MLLVAAALAGTLTVDDRAGVLDDVEEARLKQEAAALHADVIVLTSSEGVLADEAKALRTRSRQVVVAVDPEHRTTWAEIGPGIGLQKEEFALAANAGGGAFKQKRWADGLLAMMLRATTPDPKLAPAPKPVAGLQAPTLPAEEDPSIPILAVVGGLLAAVSVAAVFVLRREDRRLAATEETLKSNSRAPKGAPPSDPPPPPPPLTLD